MKKGKYEIYLIDTEHFHVEGALKVTFIKSKMRIEIILSIIFFILFLVVAIINSFYFLVIFLGFFLIHILYSIKECKKLAKGNIYLNIDEKSIFFENVNYPWADIIGVCYEKYLTAVNWREFIHIYLKNGTKFTVSLFPTPLSAEIEEIAAYVKKYWNPALQ